MIITGISHVGVQPTVQWKQQEVPIPMFGVSSQATNSSFWNDTNGAAEGVLYQALLRTRRRGHAQDAAVRRRPSSKRFGNFPSYCGYTAYDEVYYIADAIKRAGSTDPDKLVDGAGDRPTMSAPSAASSSRARTRPIRTRSRSAPTPSPA